jgi:hypothetical protein
MTHNKFDSEYYLQFPVMRAGTPAVIVSPDWDSDEDIDLIETEIRLDDFDPIPIEFEFGTPIPRCLISWIVLRMAETW